MRKPSILVFQDIFKGPLRLQEFQALYVTRVINLHTRMKSSSQLTNMHMIMMECLDKVLIWILVEPILHKNITLRLA
jgi:hypothetical protein